MMMTSLACDPAVLPKYINATGGILLSLLECVPWGLSRRFRQMALYWVPPLGLIFILLTPTFLVQRITMHSSGINLRSKGSFRLQSVLSESQFHIGARRVEWMILRSASY